jgi:GMP synthase (glutamine-hydrolysing)
MKTAFAIRHVHCEDAGLLGGVLVEAGYRLDYREAGIDRLDDPALVAADLLIILGGPIGVYEERAYPFLTAEIATVGLRLAGERPTLGICLGAQIMAKALGKAVYPSGVKEIGWAPVMLSEAGKRSPLAGLEGFAVLHWHGDTFDLPAEARHLARTELVANQAFAVGPWALALQFHLETEQAGLERWFIGHACEIAAADGIDVATLRAQTRRFAPALAPVAAEVFAEWLAGLPG